MVKIHVIKRKNLWHGKTFYAVCVGKLTGGKKKLSRFILPWLLVKEVIKI